MSVVFIYMGALGGILAIVAVFFMQLALGTGRLTAVAIAFAPVVLAYGLYFFAIAADSALDIGPSIGGLLFFYVGAASFVSARKLMKVAI